MSAEFATSREALTWATAHLHSHGIRDADREARVLLDHAIGHSLANRRLAPDEIGRATEAVRRRAQKEPLAYVIGRWSFRGLSLLVDNRVMVPRRATETLVDVIVAEIGDRAISVADVCTGSGAVALAIAVERPAIRMVASEISADALVVARANLARLQAVGRALNVEMREGDLLAPLGTERFEVISSNPPYVPADNMAKLSPELECEPKISLGSGIDGLDTIRRLVPGARANNLVPGGFLAIEHGVGQHEAVAEIFRDAGYTDVKTTLDCGNVLRVTSGRA